MGSGGAKEMKAHPLSGDPDRCCLDMQKRGRYKHLKQKDPSFVPEKQPNTVRFVCISDTHNKTESLVLNDELPEGDVLLHGGDFSSMGTKKQVNHFNEFLGQIKHKYKHIIVIAGNHEVTFDPTWSNPSLEMRLGDNKISADEAKSLLTNCTYVEDESIEVYGIKVYGSPWQPWFCDWGFNLERGEDLLKVWNKIPEETDILITHGPPLGIGDTNDRGNSTGCAELLTTIQDRVKPKYHIFGHIHESYGMWSDGVTTYINASTCNFFYKPLNKPIVFDYVLQDEASLQSTAEVH